MRKTKFSAALAAAILIASAVAALASDARPDRGSFFSQALGTEKLYRLYLPPSYFKDDSARFPVVYLLHGYNFVRNDPAIEDNLEEEKHWPEQEQVPQIADCLFTVADYDALLACLKKNDVGLPEGVVNALKAEYPECPLPLPEMIVVMPDGDSSFYINRRDGKKTWPPADGPEFVDGIRKSATGQYETYIAEDLVGHIDAAYRTKADRSARGIGGFSMGGVGSMNLLAGNPDVFSSVTSLSAMYTLSDMVSDSFFLSYMKDATPEIASIFCEDASKGTNCKIDKQYLRRNDPLPRLKNMKRKDVHIYFDAGHNDFFSGRNNFESFRKVSEALAEMGIPAAPSQHIVQGDELNGNGIHTARYWRSRVGVILTFHAKAFGLIK